MRIDDAYRRRPGEAGGVVVTFTSKDVARLAGVSQSTVSYVMTGKRPISASTRQRVLAAIEKLTYQPNQGARALASQRTNVIGLVVPFSPGADTGALLPFIETIASTARERDHEVLLVTADEGSAGLQRLAGRSLCDAIVLMDIQGRGDDRIPVAASLRVPVVLVGVPDDPMGLHCVDLDFAYAARLAVDELATTGHDRLVIISHPAEMVDRDLNFIRRFLDEALAAAERHGLPYDLISPVEPGRAAANAAVDRALSGGDGDRLGLLIPNSRAIQPVMNALNARGIVPGHDVSVIGVCTDHAAAETEPPVTNVSAEPRDTSRRAMRTLFWLLDPTAAPPPKIDLLAPRLTRRGTVMPAP
jgi:DNA-binding LacI/PurR family transcriptional regulator